jgi:hypothetical protein
MTASGGWARLEGGVVVVKDLLDDGVDLDERPGGGDGLGLGLRG